MHPTLFAAVMRCDDGTRPFAEICRAVGEAAAGAGLTQPSYETIRVFVHELRFARRTVPDARLEAIWRASVRGGYMIALDNVIQLVRGRG